MPDPLNLIILGIVLISAGLAIRYKIRQRKFKRRSLAGLEWFPSYGKAVITRLWEGIAFFLAGLMIAAGLLSFLIGVL